MMSSQEIADYERLLREVPVAVFLCDTKGKVVFYNAEAEKLWGAKPDPQQNKWCGSLKIFDSVGQPLDADNYPAAVAIRQQRISSDEIRIERPDGSQHSVIPHLKLLFTADGQVKGVLVSLTDIGPLVKQRRKIEESEKLFRDLANSIPNLAWMANADGWIFWYNQSWYEYTGTTQAEMEGWGWQSVHDPKQLPGVLNKWQASIHTGKKFEMIFPIKGADGIFRSFLTRIFPIRDAKGKVIRWFGTNTDIDEQKQLLESLEANLRESEKQIQNILKYAPDAVITIDAKGRILSWNPEAENIFGWVGKEVIGRLLSDIIIPKRLRKAHTMGIKRFLRTGKGTFINSPIEMPALNKQGEEFPVELKISSTKVDGSTIFIGFLRDISVRKKSEEIIEHKTNQLVEAQKLAHIGSWEWNIAEDSIEWSDELYRIFGLTPGQFEVNYKNYLQHIHADDREYVDGILQKASRDLEPFTFVHKILLPDATVRIVSTTGKVVPESEGRILKMSGTVQDVTAQKNYEKKIKESEERFFKIFNNNPVPLSLSEINTGKISYVNSLFCEVFGYSRDEVIGLEAVKLGIIDTEEYQRIAALVLAQLNLKYSGEKLNNLTPEETEGILLKLENSKAMKDFEVRYRRKNGESFEAIVSFEVIRLNNERYTVTSYLDITERKKAEEKLKQQNRQLEQINQELESFTYISSHDLQEPLRKIQIFAGRILDKEKKSISEKSRFQFGRIIHAAQKMQNLIQDLLAYSRTDTVKEDFERADLNAVVEEVLAEFQETILETAATIKVKKLCEINILRFQFHQLLHNLFSNSLKFARPDIPLVISIESQIIRGNKADEALHLSDRRYCHLVFKDNGIGFDALHKDKIFEVFQRLHGKDEYPGTGIGLAIVKKIVDKHQGVITATSEPEEGTTFDIYLPVG